jgi:membrane protein YqaA with SNARE-associated domain
VQAFIMNYGYLAIFVLMLAESACIPVPSELTMLFGGALAGARGPLCRRRNAAASLPADILPLPGY